MFVIEVPYMNLDHIYNSGQLFNWIKLRDAKYVVPLRDKALKIEQVKQRFIMSCTDEEFYETWYDYFDLGYDYLDINFESKKISDHVKVCATRGDGVRIVKNDLFETIITFALATATNIPRIRHMVDALRMMCGIEHKQAMRENGRITWYEFPDPKAIIDNEELLDKCKMGYRKDIVTGLCHDILDGWLDLDVLKIMPYEEAKDYLMEFNGIGPKVADCVCLYGLGHKQAFPVDTHIGQILEREYDCDCDVFLDWYLDGKKEYAGIIQQYMFYNELNPPKEVKLYGLGR